MGEPSPDQLEPGQTRSPQPGTRSLFHPGEKVVLHYPNPHLEGRR
ncbi:hypothetical protein ACIHCQ_05140 [Streptomyces sp. NPDC052236]